jgi:hypothetical protein
MKKYLNWKKAILIASAIIVVTIPGSFASTMSVNAAIMRTCSHY